jgi:hypothetical protein
MDKDQNLDTPIDDEEQLDQSSSEEQQLDDEQLDDQAGDDQDQGENADGGDDQGDEPDEQEQKPSKRANLRIQQIIQKAREGGFRPDATLPKGGLDYKDALDADDQTIKTLEDDRKQYGSQAFQEGLKRAEAIQFHTRLEIDAPTVATKYPQLNKDDADNFDPAVADAINSQYLFMVGYDPKTDTVQNPGIRYKDFVEGIMELADAAASRKVQSTSKNIAKQAAQTSLRPDGSASKRLNLNQAPSAMSDEELDAAIAQAIPKK